MIDTNIVDKVLRTGTGFENGRRRVWLFYRTEHPTTEEFAKFLKKEYGIGGSYPALYEGEVRYSRDTCTYGENGLHIEEYSIEDGKRETYDKKTLSWTEVANRIAVLINRGKYLRVADFYTGDDRYNLIKLIHS